jgi:hypothetical protein
MVGRRFVGTSAALPVVEGTPRTASHQAANKRNSLTSITGFFCVGVVRSNQNLATRESSSMGRVRLMPGAPRC